MGQPDLYPFVLSDQTIRKLGGCEDAYALTKRSFHVGSRTLLLGSPRQRPRRIGCLSATKRRTMRGRSKNTMRRAATFGSGNVGRRPQRELGAGIERPHLDHGPHLLHARTASLGMVYLQGCRRIKHLRLQTALGRSTERCDGILCHVNPQKMSFGRRFRKRISKRLPISATDCAYFCASARRLRANMASPRCNTSCCSTSKDFQGGSGPRRGNWRNDYRRSIMVSWRSSRDVRSLA